MRQVQRNSLAAAASILSMVCLASCPGLAGAQVPCTQSGAAGDFVCSGSLTVFDPNGNMTLPSGAGFGASGGQVVFNFANSQPVPIAQGSNTGVLSEIHFTLFTSSDLTVSATAQDQTSFTLILQNTGAQQWGIAGPVTNGMASFSTKAVPAGSYVLFLQGAVGGGPPTAPPIPVGAVTTSGSMTIPSTLPPSDAGGDIPTLPQWAAVFLALSLLAIILLRRRN